MTDTVDERHMRAPAQLCFTVAAAVERWPDLLPHYRWVRLRGEPAPGVQAVEMAAWRDFAGPVRYPTWWLSHMKLAPAEPAIYFVHIAGITRGMSVKWSFEPVTGSETRVRITHAWDGPAWPLVGRLAWRQVIGPHFVSFIATRTLVGIAAEAERRHRDTVQL